MHSVAWWPSLGFLSAATVIDLCTRRIPNWLSLPFLVSGLAVQAVIGGWLGLRGSLAGASLALLLFGLPCFLRVMGMGDLKLAAGVGAWVGPGQFVMAFIVTGMVGGVMAVCYALRYRSLDSLLDNTGELLVDLAKGRLRLHEDIRLNSAKALSIPYAPAIAIGTLFSFFAQ